jgi:hypothetical protein
MSKINTPEIRISYSWPLEHQSRIIAEAENREMLDQETALAKVDQYRAEWAKHEQRIINEMIRITGLNFHKTVIDVHIAQYFMPVSSDPIIISLFDEPDLFIDTLTHELLHVLLTDNNVIQIKGKDSDFDLISRWHTLFGDEHSFTTIIHIPIHAIHKEIIDNVFNDRSRVERDIDLLKQFKADDYLASWEYVNTTSHKEIIGKLVNDYKSISIGDKS